MRYDPGAKFQVDEIGRDKEAVNEELIKLRENIVQLREEVMKKKNLIKELKTKKRSVKNLIRRNKLLYHDFLFIFTGIRIMVKRSKKLQGTTIWKRLFQWRSH